MSEAREAIEKLREAQSRSHDYGEWTYSEILDDDGYEGLYGVDVVAGEDGPVICHMDDDVNSDGGDWKANAHFIVSAYNTLPLLLSEYDRLQAENERLRETLKNADALLWPNECPNPEFCRTNKVCDVCSAAIIISESLKEKK